jgi:peptidoglycan hydrolase-like protein with peptidoglycan-binding domain
MTALGQNQNANSNNSNNSSTGNTNANKKRGPVFRANKEQIKQAQSILKQRGFYAGEQTGKLDPDTREGLKKYQAAESIKVTGTLNKITLEKMNITLTDKQKAM